MKSLKLNLISLKTLRLDLPTFFTAFYLDSKKSPSSGLSVHKTRRTKENRRSLGRLAISLPPSLP